jgi:glycosyltransferase involved in cell wall biosynthesis
MIKILTFSSLYPNRCQFRHGIFVEQRLRRLLASGRVTARVVAPVPWFPFKSPRFGKYGTFAAVPAVETRHGIDIIHPRYPVIPKVGMSIAPSLMAWAMRPVLRRLVASGVDFDLIDAHYFYPDGVAAAMLGQWFKRPVVITARGSDINEFPDFVVPRKLILWAARNCRGIVTVSRALAETSCRLGVAEQKITVLRNGVDLDLFHPVDRAPVRKSLAMEGPTLLSVGLLEEGKGHHIVLSALANLPGYRLIIIGEGKMERELKRQAERLGLSDRVRFVGHLSQEKLRAYYGAADALILASAREGMPNVVLEALACGTPVIATPVGGIPEVMTAPAAGVLMTERSPAALVAAVNQLFGHLPCREETRRFAETLGWEETTRGQIALFEKMLKQKPGAWTGEAASVK